MTNSHGDTPAETDENVIHIEACCQACAETFTMVKAMFDFFEQLSASPMASMMRGGMPQSMPGLPPMMSPSGLTIPGR